MSHHIHSLLFMLGKPDRARQKSNWFTLLEDGHAGLNYLYLTYNLKKNKRRMLRITASLKTVYSLFNISATDIGL